MDINDLGGIGLVRVASRPGLPGFAPEPPAVSQPEGLVPSRGEIIAARIGELEIEREETEMAIADIRAQLDMHHDDKAWRAKAKAALRYRGIDHQAILREIGTLKREQKALDHSGQSFSQRFTDLAKIMLPAETYGVIRDLALSGATHVAQAGTRPQGQDGGAGLVRSTSDAVGNADAPEPLPHTTKGI